MTHSKVYITNDTGLKFDKATAFGALVMCVVGKVDVFHPDRVKKMVDDALENFDARKDFLLVAGASLPAAFALSFLTLHADDGRKEEEVLIKFLMFDSKRSEYFVRTVPI